MPPRDCRGCEVPFTPRNGNQQWCELCRSHDKHRNRARDIRVGTMFVACDIESRRDGERQVPVTLSFGREDGTAATHTFAPGPAGIHAGLMWLIDNLCGRHFDPDGREWKQAPIGFHLNHDAAVYGTGFDETDMFLVHKAIQRGGELTPLCAAEHGPEDDPCEMVHRYDPAAVRAVITDGAESDLIGYHPGSHLALAFTPGRRIYIEHRPNGDLFAGRRTVDVHDIGRAFVGGLEAVIDCWRPVLSEDMRAVISAGKAARPAGFPGWTPTDLAAYSEAECVALTRCARLLLNTVRSECHVKVKETGLFGAGSIANATLRHYRTPKREEQDLGEEWLALMTYFGGMIETPVIGRVRETIHEQDINSAYPDKLQYVPCMKNGCGKWKAGQQIPATASIGHVLVSWDITGHDTSTPPFMVRDSAGNVYQPLRGDHILVSLAEYRTGDTRFAAAITKHRAWWWVAKCTCGNPMPFEFLADLYDRRVAIKAEMKQHPKGSDAWQSLNVRQEAVKLVLNSMYGKMAQQRPSFGVYTNLHTASFITGATRAQVREKTWQVETAGGTVVYQHTDSVKFTGADIPAGGGALGQWGGEPDVHDFFIIQPGFALPVTPGGKGSTRGVRKADAYDAIPEWIDTVDLTLHPADWPALVINTNRMISRRQAISRGKPHTAGTFESGTMDILLRGRKRDLVHATRRGEAWIVPPLPEVPDPATLTDRLGIKEHFDQVAQLEKEEDLDVILSMVQGL
jgi:hypothetical protein